MPTPSRYLAVRLLALVLLAAVPVRARAGDEFRASNSLAARAARARLKAAARSRRARPRAVLPAVRRGRTAAVPRTFGPHTQSSIPNDGAWIPNGEVEAMLASGTTTYVGGDFFRVGPYTGGGVPLDATTGLPPSSFAKVNGPVQAVIPDGNGGWFIGGHFTAVSGQPHVDLAHILSDGSLDASWNTGTDSDADGVWALALDGSTLYVGGDFFWVGNDANTRNHLAAVDAQTGAVLSWAPDADAGVMAFAVSGSTLFAGGFFSTIGTNQASLPGLAALDPVTGRANLWNPNLVIDPNNTGPAMVSALAVNGGTLYAGGNFISAGVGASTRNYLASFDAVTGALGSWNPDADGDVTGLVYGNSTVYVTGDFVDVGGMGMPGGTAAVDPGTGIPTSFRAPNVSDLGISLALSPDGTILYAGGLCLWEGSCQSAQAGLYALDSTSGTVLSWAPLPGGDGDGFVNALATQGTSVYAGGIFTLMGGAPRSGAAAFDSTTGGLMSWNPSAQLNSLYAGAPGAVYALALSSDASTVYLGGNFDTVGGQPRESAAAVDARSGALAAWNPVLVASNTVGPSPGLVSAIAVGTSSVYLGGTFDSVGGQTLAAIAAVDPVSGSPTSWNPTAACAQSTSGGCGRTGGIATVDALLVVGTTVYAAGAFDSIGGQTRGGLAALDSTSGNASSWNPSPDDQVFAFAVSGSTLYAGGAFSHVGGAARNGLAAVDAGTGRASSWNPASSGAFVFALGVDGTSVYAGGTGLGESTGTAAAAYDAATGSVTWSPNIAGTAQSIAFNGSVLSVGGELSGVGIDGHPDFAQFPLAPAPAPTAFPSGLTALAQGVSSVTWTWGVLSGASSYAFYPSTGGAPIPVAALSLTLKYLSANTPYGGRIAGVTAGGTGPLSETVTAYTLVAPPVALSTTGVSITSAAFQWGADGNSAATKYVLSRWLVGGSSPTVTFSTTQAVVAGLLPNATYFFNVQAENAALKRTPFDPAVEIALRTLPLKPASAPKAVAVGADSETVRWDWPAIAGEDEAASYVFYPSTGGTQSAIASTSLVVTGLSPNTAYSGKFQALNATGAGPLSAAVTGYTLAAPPQGLAFVQVNITSATVMWDPQGNPPGTKYLLSHWIVGKGTSTVTVSPVDPSVNVSTVTGLLANTAYTVNVQAENEKLLKTAFDSTVEVSTLTLPSKPTAAPKVTAVDLDTGTVRFSWTAVSGADEASGYVFTFSTGTTIATSATFLDVPVAEPNTPISGKVQAVNAIGAGPLSASATGYSLAAAPVDLSTTAVNVTSMTVAWGSQNNAPGTKYIVSRWIVGKTTTPVTVEMTSEILMGLTANTVYQINVQAENAQGKKTAFAGQIPVKTLQTNGVLSSAVKGWPYGGKAMKFGYAAGESFSVGMKTVSLWKAADAAVAALNTTGTAVVLSLPPGLGGDGSFIIYTRAAVPVRELDLGELTGGFDYYIEWDGKNGAGAAVAPGAYYGIFSLPGVAQNALIKLTVTAAR